MQTQNNTHVVIWSLWVFTTRAQLIAVAGFIFYGRHQLMSRIYFTLALTSDSFEMRFHFDSSSFSQIKIPGLSSTWLLQAKT